LGEESQKRKLKMKNKIITLALISLILIIVLTNFSYALSNESIQAKEKLSQAKNAIKEMINLKIPITRVNETYSEAEQIYNAQINLEQTRKKADYKLVIDYAERVILVKKIATQASDELKVFINFYNESSKKFNLSEMDKESQEIITSFKDERFEDTTKLINLGYDKISEIESSQTTINAFKSATSKTLKNFFKENWLKLLIGFGITTILLVIFRTSIKIILVKKKKRNLQLKKETLKNLIKKLQGEYFNKDKISQLQYETRLNKFGEMIRDVDRELPLLDEKISAAQRRKDIKKFKKVKKHKR